MVLSPDNKRNARMFNKLASTGIENSSRVFPYSSGQSFHIQQWSEFSHTAAVRVFTYSSGQSFPIQ